MCLENSSLLNPTNIVTDPSLFAHRLQSSMAAGSPATIYQPHTTPALFPAKHDSCTHPLQLLYDGPFKVIRRTNKYYEIEMWGRSDTVSLDRLEPAHCDTHPDSTFCQSSCIHSCTLYNTSVPSGTKLLTSCYIITTTCSNQIWLMSE